MKLAHADATKAHEGLLAIALFLHLSVDRVDGLSRADLDDPRFQQVYRDVQGASTTLSHQSGGLPALLARGPAHFDSVIAYESVAFGEL